jgi:plastocyanin
MDMILRVRRPFFAVLALAIAAWAVHPFVLHGPLDGVVPDVASSTPTAAAAAPTSARPILATAATAHATVRIDDFEYRPAILHVHAGTRVTWRNDDIANHTVTFHGPNPGSIDNIDPRLRASRTFKHPGRFTYICAVHPFMRATVVVEP